MTVDRLLLSVLTVRGWLPTGCCWACWPFADDCWPAAAERADRSRTTADRLRISALTDSGDRANEMWMIGLSDRRWRRCSVWQNSEPQPSVLPTSPQHSVHPTKHGSDPNSTESKDVMTKCTLERGRNDRLRVVIIAVRRRGIGSISRLDFAPV